jgi:hypothetical protein
LVSSLPLPPARSGNSGPLSCAPTISCHRCCQLPSLPGAEGARALPRVSPRAVTPADAAASTDCLLFPAQPSLRLRLSRWDLLLNPFIVSARLRVCSPPSHLARATRAPSFASTSSCHRATIYQACPALSAPGSTRAFNRARLPRQVRQQAWMLFFSWPNHLSASGYLRGTFS